MNRCILSRLLGQLLLARINPEPCACFQLARSCLSKSRESLAWSSTQSHPEIQTRKNLPMNPGIWLGVTFRTEIQETDANPRRPQELQNDRHHVCDSCEWEWSRIFGNLGMKKNWNEQEWLNWSSAPLYCWETIGERILDARVKEACIRNEASKTTLSSLQIYRPKA